MKQSKIERIIKGRTAHIYSSEQIEEIINEIASGQLSIPDAMAKYEVKRNTIRTWVIRCGKSDQVPSVKKKFTSAQRRQIIYEVDSNQSPLWVILKKYGISENAIRLWRKQYLPELIGTKIPDMAEKEIPTAISKNLVEELKLKIAALETMIDVAEKEYRIEIRKKSGTKQ